MSDIREDIDIDWLMFGVSCSGRYNTYTLIEDNETIQIQQEVVSNELNGETT